MDDVDLILVTQSNVLDYEGYGKLPLDRLDLYKSLVYPRMVHHGGAFRSHLDYLNHARFGKYFDDGTYPERRQMMNIWNLPSMSGVHLANYLTQFGLRVRVINNLDAEWDWFAAADADCRRPPLVGISSTFYLSWKEVGNVAKRLRTLDPDMNIVLGGAFANAETIHNSPNEFAARMRRFGIRYVLHAFNSEPDLRDLIRSFGQSDFKAATQRTGILHAVAQGSKVSHMFAWFQRLLPRTGNFFDMFEAHAGTVVAGADALARLLQDGSGEHIREVIEREHDADEIIREVLRTVRQTFLTPFDRGAIISLIGALDDSIDEMQATVQAIDLYEVTSFEPEMKDMAAIIVDAARLTAEAMPLLRDVARNAVRLHELTERLVRMESHADEIHTAGLKRAYKELGPADPLRFSVHREVYKHLERIVDAFEDVANEIDGIVIDHA